MVHRAAIVVLALTLIVLAPVGHALLPGSAAPALPPAPAASGPSGYEPTAEPGSHLVTHYRLSPGTTTELLHILNTDGELAVRLRMSGSRLQVLDARETPVWVTISSPFSHWQRLDIVLEGASALVTHNQVKTVRVNTSAFAEEGTVAFPPSNIPIERGLTRYDGAHAVAMESFVRPSLDSGLITVGGASRLLHRTASTFGHRTAAHLEVRPSVVPQPAFIAIPVDGLGGTYVAEAAANVQNLLSPPTGMVVLAGLSGSLDAPVTEWEVRFARDPAVPFGVRLVYSGPDGTSAVVSSTKDTAGTWRHLRAVVDEPAGRIAFVVDEAEAAAIVAPSGGLGASAWIAFGDLGVCVCDDGRAAGATFDDVAVIDIPPPPPQVP